MAVWLGLLMYLVLITPIRLGLQLEWEQGRLPRGRIGVLIWGAAIQRQFFGIRDENGTLRIETDFPVRKSPANSQGAGDFARAIIRAFKTLKRANVARGLLKKSIRLDRLDIRAHIGLEDAAATAMLSGALRAAGIFWRRGEWAIIPCFGQGNALYGRCILESRLGMIAMAGLLGLISDRLTEKKEEKTWIIPSDT